MKKYLHFASVGMLCFALLLIPNSFSAQGKGKGGDKNDKHGNNDDHKDKGGKGGKGKIDIKIDFGKKGKGDPVHIVDNKHPGHGHGHGNGHGHGHKHGHGFYGFGHPGRGHAYGHYKWKPSVSVVDARIRHRDLLVITVALIGTSAIFMSNYHPRLHKCREKMDIRIKAGGLDIKVKERREARIKHAEIKAKELDDLLSGAKVKLKIS